jgi:hypothetical protein
MRTRRPLAAVAGAAVSVSLLLAACGSTSGSGAASPVTSAPSAASTTTETPTQTATEATATAPPGPRIFAHQVSPMVTDPDGYQWQVEFDVRLKDIEVDPTNSKPGRAAVRWQTSVGAMVRNMTPQRANPVSLGFQYYAYLGMPQDSVFCAPDARPGVRVTQDGMCYRQFATFVDKVYAEHGFFNVHTPPVLDAKTTDLMNVAVISGLDDMGQFPTEREAQYEATWVVDMPESMAQKWKESWTTMAPPKLLLSLQGPNVQDRITTPCDNSSTGETPISISGPEKYDTSKYVPGMYTGHAPKACDILG